LPDEDDGDDDNESSRIDHKEYLEAMSETFPSLETLKNKILAPGENICNCENRNDGKDDDKDRLASQSVVDEEFQAPMMNDDKHSRDHLEKHDSSDVKGVEYGKCDSILVVQNEVDDGALASCGSDLVVAGDSYYDSFIPFEAFSKLGESMVVDSHNGADKSISKDHSDDESIIPGESFM